MSQKYKLIDLAANKLEYGSGAAAVDYDGEVRYIRITDIDENGKLTDNYVSPSTYDDKYILNDGDILFARTGATVGKTYRFKKTDGNCIFAGFLIRFIPNTDLVLSDYVYYFTKSPQYKQFVLQNMRVVAQPNINAKLYGDLEMFVHSLEEQKVIIEKLNKIEKLIDLKKEELLLLDNLIKSRFVEMFGNPITNSKSLSLISLGEACHMKAGKSIKACNISEDFEDGLYLCYGGNGIRGYVEDYSHEGDIPLIGRQGALCGNVQYASGKFYATEHAVVTQPKLGWNPRWLFIMLKEMNLNRLASGAAQPGLNVSTLVSLEVINPPIDQQDIFATFVQQVDKLKVEVLKSLDETQILFDSLMQQYFG